MATEALAAIEAKLGGILESALNVTNEDDAYAALAGLVTVTSQINGVISSTTAQQGSTQAPAPGTSQPGAVANLQGWIQKIKAALEALAAFLKAASYSVGVSVPLGLSVQITFNV